MPKLAAYYLAILNAIPLPVFVVDNDVQIRDLNQAAETLFRLDKEKVLQHRGGDVLHCLHSTDSPEGCGRGPHCSDCLIRNSVQTCLGGQTIHRRRMRFTVKKEGVSEELELLITAAPLPLEDETLALLIMEDITEVSVLKSIIPICMHCKKIRNDQHYWQRVENYFHHSIGVDFSHGICPDCVQERYPEFRRPEPV